MTLLRSCAVLLASCLVVPACSGDDGSDGDSAPGFDLSAYDAACTTAAECAVVSSGDPCSCDCTFGAVSSGERSRVGADRAAVREARCPGPMTCGVCDEPLAACTGGRCTTE